MAATAIVFDKMKQFENDEEKIEIINYFLEQIVFNEMIERKIAPPGDYRIINIPFYEKERKEYNFKRSRYFNNSENVKILNLCSEMRVFLKKLPEGTSRNYFVSLICELNKN